MTKRIVALVGALVLLLAFFTACGKDNTPTGGGAPQTNAPQLVVAVNPVMVLDDTTVIAYNDMNTAMAADSSSSSLTAIADSAWSWAYDRDGTWADRAVYGFGGWKSGAGAKAKGVFAYAFNEAGSLSLGVYKTKANELVTYQDETLPEVGVLLSAVAGEEEALVYTVPQDGSLTIPAGTLTAVEQVAGVKTGFLAEDGTARSASVRILVNQKQVYSGTLCNTTAAEDGTAVTQLSYPQISDMQVKAQDVVIIAVKLEAQANSDEDVTAPTVDEDDNWKVVRKPTQVEVDKNDRLNQSDVTADDGSIPMVADFQFTFSVVREDRYIKMAATFMTTVMKRTGTEVITTPAGKENKYELVIGVHAARSESAKIYKEITTARADNAADYVIRLVGTKIYIVGVNDDALQAALDYFLATFVKDDSGRIPAKYNYYYQPEHVTYMVAGANIAGYTIRTERYPSLVVQRAAEAVQRTVLEQCGYIIPIKAMNLNGTDAGDKEIRIGPMNGAVKAERVYDTRFTSGNWQNYYTRFDSDGMLAGDYGYYQVTWDGNSVAIEGGSAYAVNVGTMKMLAELTASKALTTSYAVSGTYESYFDYQMKGGYDKVDFAMADGFGLVYAEEFDYIGTDEEKDKIFRSKWSVNNDQTADSTSPMYQYRPGVYGTNWWVAADTVGNNYLFEVTKKRVAAYGDENDHGYDAVRMAAAGKWGFRFGIWETRLVSGTRNGACSAVWSNTGAPYSTNKPWHEIDVYENYGRDYFIPCYHAFAAGGKYLGEYCFQAPYYQSACTYRPNEGEHLYDTFHHVTVDWTYDYLRVYFDGMLGSEMMLTADSVFTPFRNGQTIKLANGVGEYSYCSMNPPPSGGTGDTVYVPEYWLGLYGKSLSEFFEVQVVDYTRVYQTSNDHIEYKQAENDIQFASSFGRVR